MAFTTREITHTFTNADGTPASGVVNFWLTQRMTNDGSSLVPSEITASLDASGHLDQEVTCNNDADTKPVGATWRVDMRILGSEMETYFISVPSGVGTVDLGSLLPEAQQVG